MIPIFRISYTKLLVTILKLRDIEYIRLYNQLINPIGLDRTLIEELKPSTNHEYISSKYHNENKEAYKQNQHTPLLTGKDTNILREYNLYTSSIERLYSYNINNTHARGFNDKNDKTDFADKNNNIDQSVHTNSDEIKTLNTEEKKSGYADFAFGFPAEPTQSACLKFS